MGLKPRLKKGGRDSEGGQSFPHLTSKTLINSFWKGFIGPGTDFTSCSYSALKAASNGSVE